MKFEIALSLLCVLVVNAFPAAPRSSLKQITRGEILQHQQDKLLHQKRVVPLPSNTGYLNCDGSTSGGQVYAVFTSTFSDAGVSTKMCSPWKTYRS
jgi:hypothetical protein